MTAPDLTLAKAKETVGVREHRVSDFLTREEVEEVRQTNAKGKKEEGFDVVDAYIAEMIARFGYDTYMAWKAGDISEEQMLKYIQAERVREIASSLPLKSLILAVGAGANQPTKSGHAPKSLKTAVEILKKEQNRAKGGK